MKPEECGPYFSTHSASTKPKLTSPVFLRTIICVCELLRNENHDNFVVLFLCVCETLRKEGRLTDPPAQCWFSLSIMGGHEVNMGSMNRRADMFDSSRSDRVLGWLPQCKS